MAFRMHNANFLREVAMKCHHLLSLILCGLLFGCASPSPELRPDDGGSVVLELYETENLVKGFGFVSVNLDDYDCFGFSTSAATKVTDMPTVKSISISGRRFLTVIASYHAADSAAVKSCSSAYTFPIHRGARYRLSVGNNEKYCSISIEEIGAGGVELNARDFQTSFSDGNGPWCKADERFKGSSAYQVPRGNEK